MKNRITIIASVLMISATCLCGVFNYCFAATDMPNNKTKQSATYNNEMEQYVSQTRRNIKANWYPPTKSFEHEATIVLVVSRDGHLEKCFISHPSGDKDFDESLLNAAQKAEYSPLPKYFPGRSAEIELDFSMQRRTVQK